MKKFYITTYNRKTKQWKRQFWGHKTLEKAEKAFREMPLQKQKDSKIRFM